MSDTSPEPRELVVIGGGFSGACIALTVARKASFAVRISIIEPRAAIGQGIAYHTPDPEHRINATVYSHSIIPEDADHLARWCEQAGVYDDDPQAQTDQGAYIRRADYARYIDASIKSVSCGHPGTSIAHLQSRCDDAHFDQSTSQWRLKLDSGESCAADMVVVATGNPPARLPGVLRACAEHSAFVASPWDRQRIEAIAPDATVVVMGAALTTADILASLIARGHQGKLVAFSRHGLRPTTQNPMPEASAPIVDMQLCERLSATPPPWLADVMDKPGAGPREYAQALRRQIRATRPDFPWQHSFDELRNTVWQIWPRFSAAHKRQYLRHLRPWYDAHRFRIAPQTLTLLEQARDRGQLEFLTARLDSVTAGDNPDQLNLSLASELQHIKLNADALINCTGFDLSSDPAPDSLLGRLLDNEQLTRDASSMGYRVDTHGSAINQQGEPDPLLRVVGPPTAGVWGDPLGAVFIAMQIRRLMPDMLTHLQS